MENIKEVKLEVQVFKYETKEEQAAHAVDMQKQGFEVKYMGECYTGKSNWSEFRNPDNWQLVTEFYKAEVNTGEPGIYYEIQSRVY